MALVELSHSGTKFAEITIPTGSVTLNTKDKLVDDFIKVRANVTDPSLIPENIRKNITLFGVTGNYEPKNVQVSPHSKRIASTTYTATGASITVAKTGTYNISWIQTAQAAGSSSAVYASQYYVNGTAGGSVHYATAVSSTTEDAQIVTETNVSLTAGQTVEIRARSRGTSYYIIAGMLAIEEV